MGIFSEVITADTFSRTTTMGISGKTLTLNIYGNDPIMDTFSKAITRGIFSMTLTRDVVTRPSPRSSPNRDL